MEEQKDEVEQLVAYYLEESKKTRKLIAISSITISALGVFLLGYYTYIVTNDINMLRSVLVGIFSSIGLILIAILMWRNEKQSEQKTKEIYEKYQKEKEQIP